VSFLALDEADEMLDMGFAEDLEAILQRTPPGKQTALFSATLPSRVAAIAGRHLKDPARVTIAREKTVAGRLPRVRQVAYLVSRAHKPLALARVLEVENPSAAIVFCRTRLEVDELVENLSAHGYRAEALHGGMVQKQRDRVMGLFRAQKAELLVATDVAARGLDIEHLSHVVNYDVPSAPEAYVHRIGRTGRIGRSGVAITLAEPREHRLLRNIEAFTRQKIEMQRVPTVADLRSRRLELVQATLRERLVGGDFDDVKVVVEALSGEFDLVEIAAAAVKAVLEADGRAEEKDLPEPGRPPGRAARSTRAEAGRPMVRLFVGAGRAAGVRPGDLVGAITGETGHDSRVVGSIEISDRFSIVEVPVELEKEITTALRGTTLRGRKVVVSRDRGKKRA
jgi:ATP-dependent RNA helicase DeaD